MSRVQSAPNYPSFGETSTYFVVPVMILGEIRHLSVAPRHGMSWYQSGPSVFDISDSTAAYTT